MSFREKVIRYMKTKHTYKNKLKLTYLNPGEIEDLKINDIYITSKQLFLVLDNLCRENIVENQDYCTYYYVDETVSKLNADYNLGYLTCHCKKRNSTYHSSYCMSNWCEVCFPGFILVDRVIHYSNLQDITDFHRSVKHRTPISISKIYNKEQYFKASTIVKKMTGIDICYSLYFEENLFFILFDACKYHNISLFNSLYSEYIDNNYIYILKLNVLFPVLLYNFIDAFELILQSVDDITTGLISKRCILYWCIEYHNTKYCEKTVDSTEAIKYLINKGIDININITDWNALSHCFQVKSIQLAEIVIAAGANINAVNKNNHSPLFLCCIWNYTEGIEFMLNKGARTDVICNEHGNTMLFHCCYNKNNIAMIKLIDAGIDMDIINHTAENALSLCISNNYYQEFVCLIQLGASLRIENDFFEVITLHNCCFYRNKDMLLYLISRNIDLNIQSHYNSETAIHVCCNEYIGDKKTIWIEGLDILMQNNANLNLQDHEGLSALHIACINKNIAIIKRLLHYKTKLNLQDDQGCTALHTCCMNGFSEGLRLILLHYPDVTIRNHEGKTALDLAQQYKNPSLIIPIIRYVEPCIFPLSKTPVKLQRVYQSNKINLFTLINMKYKKTTYGKYWCEQLPIINKK